MATTINDILNDIRLKAMTEREKGTDFERLMKLWFKLTEAAAPCEFGMIMTSRGALRIIRN